MVIWGDSMGLVVGLEEVEHECCFAAAISA
jgi:hypothetical protein